MPKGWPIDGLSPAECAAREAEEEAGVKGKVLDECLGLFSYSKSMQDAEAIPCIVAVYPLRVTSLATNFPERRQRQRKWFPLEQAALLLQELEAQTVVSAFAGHALLQVDRAGTHRRARNA